MDADLFGDVEPLLPIARALKESIDAKLVGAGTESPLDVDAAWDAAVRAVAEELIAERLRDLDPEQVLRLYAETADDETLKATLGRWAAAKAAELESTRQVARVQAECARTGALDLSTLDTDVRITIGLFEPRQIGQAYKESAVPPARSLSVRLLEPSQAYVEVIADTPLLPSAGRIVAPQTRGRIGSRTSDGTGERLEPRLQVHAPLGYEVGDGVQTTTEVIGFAELGGVLVLDGAGGAR